MQVWWRRRDHRIWQRRANAGEIFDKTQNLVQKATQAKNTWECFWLRGVVPRSWILQDTKLGFWRQFGNGVLTEACSCIFGDGSGTHSDPRIIRVVWSAVIIQGVSNCLGQTLECWKLHSEWLMNSLKPTGGWVAPLGEGEPGAVGRAELMAFVVTAESTRGNVVYVTDYEILKRRQDRGWPTPRLGQGSNPDPWWRMSRGKEHSRCSGSERTLRLQTSSVKTTTRRSYLAMRWLMRWPSRRRAKRRCEERQQGRYPGWTRWHGRSNGGSLRQTCRPEKTTPTILISREKGLRRAQYKTVFHSFSEQSTHQLAFRRSRQRWECQVCKQSIGETSVVRWLRAGPCAAEIQCRVLEIILGWEFSTCVRRQKYQMCGKSCIPRIQWPNIEVFRGAGIVRHHAN